MLQVLKGGPQFIQDDDMLGGSFYTPEVALTLKTEHLFFLFLICEMGKNGSSREGSVHVRGI